MSYPKRTSDLRRAAREIFDHALRAVDAHKAVDRAVSLDGDRLAIGESVFDIRARKVYAVAIGKAAVAMAAALNAKLGERLDQGVLSGYPLDANTVLSDRWQTFRGGHPLPNQQSLDAADAVFTLLRRASDEQAVVVFLISGGGSAMLESPCWADVSLADLHDANRQLISCGATITEINSVRAAFSAVKAGGLARAAVNCDQLTLIVSDTNAGDDETVASGPTLPRRIEAVTPRQVVERYNLAASLPGSILKCIESFAPQETVAGNHYVLLNNRTAVDAAAYKAKELGFVATLAEDIGEQPIAEGCRLLLDRLEELSRSSAGNVCLISGGEFSCPVRGDGIGGRNLETALRCAIELDKRGFAGVVLSAGTDGIDGNSPAAGAVADELTIQRAMSAGLNANQILEQSDSFTLFDRIGDAITTGATGTNVRDLRILLGE